MPLTQIEMHFVTNHAYELHDFSLPCHAHMMLHALDPNHKHILWEKFRVFQYIWQEQGRDTGVHETFFPWSEAQNRPLLLFLGIPSPLFARVTKNSTLSLFSSNSKLATIPIDTIIFLLLD
jgi:hypothetical protein